MRITRAIITPIILLLIFSSIPFVYAVYTLPSRPIYFRSKSGAYITFPTDDLPLTFTTLYRDTNCRWHFNNSWITTTIDMTINAFFINGWFNYSIGGVGTQEVRYGEPTKVYLDDVAKDSGDGWTYGSNVATVTDATTTAYLFYGTVSKPPEGGGLTGQLPMPPAYRPENYTYEPPLFIPTEPSESTLTLGLGLLIGIVLFFGSVGVLSRFGKSPSRRTLYRAKRKAKHIRPSAYQKRKKKPKRR